MILGVVVSSDDRDDTPRGHRRPISQPASAHWDDDRRATVGRRRVTTAVRGTTIGGAPVVLAQRTEVDDRDPVEHEAADRTPVFELVDEPITKHQAHDLIKWVQKIARKLEDASSEEKRNMDELRTLFAQPPPAAVTALQAQVDELRARPAFAVVDRLDRIDRDLAEFREILEGDGKKKPGLVTQVEDHDTVIKPTRSLARWAFGGAATAALLLAAFLYDRGDKERGVRDQIQQLERTVDRLDQHDRDRRFSFPDPHQQGTP